MCGKQSNRDKKMRRSEGPPSIEGTGENPARPANMFSYLHTNAPATAGAQASSQVPSRASYAHLGPFRGGASRFDLSATGVSPAQSSQLDSLLAGHTALAHNNNDMNHDLLLPTPSRVVQAHQPSYWNARARGNGVSTSLTMQPQSSRRFSFQSPQSHSTAPNDNINSGASAQIQANYYLDSVLVNSPPTIPHQPRALTQASHFRGF